MEIFFRDRRERHRKQPSQGYAYHLSPSPVATNALLITAAALFDPRPQSPVLLWTPQGRILVKISCTAISSLSMSTVLRFANRSTAIR
jgi:hypothetical protein